MVTIHIDGQPHEANPKENLLQACLEAGVDLPYFCWHPELGSVGACRQCAVKQFANAEDTRGRIVMACMTPVTEGAIVSVADAEATEFRGEVVEWLMTNHPHDCPVCEEGGECHLQDMTVMTGHRERRYRFEKRTHRNQDLGPFVKHEMNRCISCYRCVRFYRDYAGGEDLAAFSSHNNVYFGRHESGTLESPFAGNLIEVCPTGVFTDKPFSTMYSRKWDMRGAPSVCTHCSVGCNTIINERAGKVRRTLNRYNDEVNRYFLCDRGRFGHGFVNAVTRLRSAGVKQDGQMAKAPVQYALQRFAEMAADGPMIGIGSTRASLESNFALRALVGPSGFSTGVAEPIHGVTQMVVDILHATPAKIPTLHEMEQSDGVLVLGEDVSATAPRLSLALRQTRRHAFDKTADGARVPRWMDAAVRTLGADVVSPLFVVSPAVTDLDGVAQQAVRAVPDDIARLGFAIAHRIDAAAPAVSGLTEDEADRAALLADALLVTERPLVVSGTQYASPALLQASANIAAALAARGKDVALSLVVPDANSVGLALLGGMSLDTVKELALAGRIGTLVVLENDLTRSMDVGALDAMLAAVKNVVLIEHSVTPFADRADVILPSTTYSECGGTLVSMEGRAQRFLQVVTPDAPLQVGWRWVRDLARAAGQEDGFAWPTLDEVIADIAQEVPALSEIGRAAPGEGYLLEGEHIRSQTHRVSGRTAIRAEISVRDRPVPAMPDSPLSPTMEGTYGTDMPGSLVPFYQVPGWNSEQSLNRFQQEIGGPMRGGDGGVRVLRRGAGHAYHTDVPAAFVAREGEMLLLPENRVFGTDEMSMLSAPIAARAEPAYVRMGGDIGGAGEVDLLIGAAVHRVAVKHDPGVPPGVALCPPHMLARAFAAPVWVRIQEPGR